VFITEPEFASFSDFISEYDPAEIPEDFSDYFAENPTFDYTIQEGDTLSEIAEANHTSIERLMELNPQISDPNMIYTGDQLVIPEGDQINNPYQSSEQTNALFDNNVAETATVNEYTIQEGDTLSEIAEANHTSIERLMELNPHISDPNMIYSGDQLVIPTGDQIDNPYQTSSETEGILFEPSSEELSQIEELYPEEGMEFEDYNQGLDSLTPAESIAYEDQVSIEAESEYLIEEEAALEDYELNTNDEMNSEYEMSVEDDSLGWEDSEGFSSEFEQTDFSSYDATDSYEDSSFLEDENFC
jgi:LysM repeat protein